ncbi:MAG TPA: hypothetical protein VFW69_02870 [Mycobacterium sp.]|nr:hypothetical protein [Mycobacterium sp.]
MHQHEISSAVTFLIFTPAAKAMGAGCGRADQKAIETGCGLDAATDRLVDERPGDDRPADQTPETPEHAGLSAAVTGAGRRAGTRHPGDWISARRAWTT